MYEEDLSNRAGQSNTIRTANFSWLAPFLFVICLGIIILVVGAFLFCKCFRTTILQCFCCCCCCCSDEESKVGDEAADSNSASGSESAGNTQVPPQPPPPPPSLLPPAPQVPTMLPPAPPMAISYVPTAAPPQLPSQAVQTTRTQGASMRAQKPNGFIASGRRTLPPQQSNYATPSTAPPAARQVARTAKIIGNILAFDKGKRKK